MIILEGPDGSGKTSLAEKLSHALDAPIMPKLVSGDMTIMGDTRKYVAEAIEMGFSARIYDRFTLFSAPIYTAMSRRVTPQDGYDDYNWQNREYARLRDVAPLTIICLPSFDRVWENCQRDPDNAKIFPAGKEGRRKCATVYWLYFNLAARNPAMLRYNYELDNTDQLINQVSKMLANRGA